MKNTLKTFSKSDVVGKTVLVRVDFNTPLKQDKQGKIQIADTRRIDASQKTIEFLYKSGAKVVLISHLGRPKQAEEKYSLKPASIYLQKLLGVKVDFLASEKVVDKNIQEQIKLLPTPSIILLENTRFESADKKNDAQFARKLASVADVFVNEAFSASHREHASTVGVAKLLPSFAGFNLKKEVETLSKLLTNPPRPFVIVLGGAKISDKVGAITHLAKIADIVLVGGAVANDFLKAEGIEIHKSYLETTPADLKKEGVDYVQVAKQLLDTHRGEKMLKDDYIPLPKILYPLDVVAAPHPQVTQKNQLEILDLTRDMLDTDDDLDLQYLDIGPKTTRLFSEIIATAGSVFWNGPMGVWENPLFASGTKKLAQTMANRPYSVVGGGDSISAIDAFKLTDKFEYVSLAGGATLEFLSGETLPGIAVLD